MTATDYPKKTVPIGPGSQEPSEQARGTVQRTGRKQSAAPSRFVATEAKSDRFSLTYLDPPAEIERYVLALFYFAWEEGEILDRHPGALSQLTLMPYGKGELYRKQGAQPVEGEAIVLGGFSTAIPFKMNGPWHAIGASLSPLGWAALTQRPLCDHLDQFYEPSSLLDADVDRMARETNDLYRSGAINGEEACEMLADWIAPRLQPIPHEHELVIEKTIGWLGSSLNPDVEALFDQIDYSRRQAERLVKRYIGLNPAALARKYRAIRAAALLGEPDLSDEAEAEIATAFYDQPHMIREIRRYCGYTPTRLGGPRDPLFQQLLRMKNLDRFRNFRAIG